MKPLPPEWHYIKHGDLADLALATDIVDEAEQNRPNGDGDWDEDAQ